MENLPTLTTLETQRLRADYPSIEHLEAGNVAAWLVERQEQLLVRARDERTGMNLAKLIALAGSAVGAVCYATSPLALIGAALAGVGYVWAVAQDLNDSHQFAPIPFVRGNIIEFLSAMGDFEARLEWFANQNELVDLMFHLSPFERYEFALLKENVHKLTDFLVGVEAGKRFYAYRWLLDWYIQLKGNLPSKDSLTNHLTTVTPDPRINYHAVGAIQQHQAQMLIDVPDTPTVDLPDTPTVGLPQAEEVDLPVVVGPTTKLEAIDVDANPVEPEPAIDAPALSQRAEPTPQNLIGKPLRERAIAIIDQLLASGFDLSRCVDNQIVCICGNQRGGKGTLMAILAILMKALEPTTLIHYFTAGDDVYPFQCDRLICRLSYSKLDGSESDRRVASELYRYLKYMDEATQAEYKDIILVIDEAVALSDYLEPEQKQWIIRFLLTRANKKGAQIFVVLHGNNLTSWVGTGNTGGFSSTFKSGATFIGCEATSKKISPLRSLSLATGRYFVANPDEFAKPIEGGDLGVIPEWLKTEINPITGQPDPVRSLLTFFPELRDETHSSLLNPSRQTQLKSEPVFEAKPVQSESAITEKCELRISDSLAEPLKSIYRFAKKKNDWVTAKEVYNNGFSLLKGKGVKQIRQYFGLLADKGYGEIDEMEGDKPRSDSAVGFKAY
ncbi:MAG TPA: hypothetical protein V6D50_25440 [Chroococcales cyanobacterium]|jgi:hypothetical protein